MVFFQLAVFVHVRVAAVGQVSGVYVALAAQVGVLVQDCGEEHFDSCLVQCLVSDLLTVLTLPGQRQFEAMLSGCQVIAVSCDFDAVHSHLVDAVGLECQAGFHRVLEGNVIVLVIRHIVRQDCAQLVGHRVADVIVGAVLPELGIDLGGTFRQSFLCRVVHIRDVLPELRLFSQLVVQQQRTVFTAERQAVTLVGDLAVRIHQECGITGKLVVLYRRLIARILRNHGFLQSVFRTRLQAHYFVRLAGFGRPLVNLDDLSVIIRSPDFQMCSTQADCLAVRSVADLFNLSDDVGEGDRNGFRVRIRCIGIR